MRAWNFQDGADRIFWYVRLPSVESISGECGVETTTNYNNCRISDVKLNSVYTETEKGSVVVEMTADSV